MIPHRAGRIERRRKAWMKNDVNLDGELELGLEERVGDAGDGCCPWRVEE
jgi:hypothetical protein